MPGLNLLGTGEALDASLNTIISEFYLTRDEEVMLKKLARQHELREHSGRSYVLNTYSRVTARDLSDGVDITEGQDLADAQSTYSPAEVGLKVIVPRTTVRRIADPSLMENVGRMLSAAYNLKEEQDGTAQFDSFTITRGSAGTVMGVGHIASAVSALGVGNSVTVPEPAPGPYSAVFHPCTLHAILMRMAPVTDVPTGTNAYLPTTANRADTVGAGMTERSHVLLEQGIKAIKMMGGAQVHASANVLADASNDAKSGVFSKEGLRYISEFEPTVEKTDDKSLRGMEVVIAGSYAWGVYKPAVFGVEMLFDAIIPTS